MDFQEVPYVKLTDYEREFALGILGNSNVLFKKWSSYFGSKKFKLCCMAILNGDDNPFNCIPAERSEEFRADLLAMRACRNKAQQELGDRTVEEAILQSFAAMAKKYAVKWSSQSNLTGLTKSDYLQEAYIQIIEAMYSWLPEFDVQISTFICTALKHRMSKVCNSQGNLLSHLTRSDLNLLIQYRKVNAEQCGIGFNQVIEQIGMSKEQGKHLALLLKNVVLETELQDTLARGNADCSNEIEDYTGYRSDFTDISETEIMIQENHVQSTLDKAGLSSIERELIELAMSPYYGWQSEFAANHINPTTKKPYSRMRITQMLEIARAKVAMVLSKSKAA